MSTLYREIGLSLYRLATLRIRSTQHEYFTSQQAFPASVLFYHRVATHSMNPWTIEKRNFERQLDWIGNHAVPVSLDDVWESQRLGKRDKPMVAVTFDDGYSDNWEHAIPALMERKIPFTYFATTHYIETGEPFPHDLARGVPLKPNTVAQIQEMAQMGIEIGAHSHTHIDFGRPLSEAELRREITDVRKRLQDWTGQPIHYFAFPYGLQKNISQRAIDTVFDSGYKCFVSAMGGVNLLGHNANHLQRIHGDPGMSAIKNWLTFDPRKMKSTNIIESMFRIPIGQQPCSNLPHPHTESA